MIYLLNLYFSYNKKRGEFQTDEEYNRYLEEIEDKSKSEIQK
jgi:hypothetical protein